MLAGGGPEQQALADRLGDDATFLGWQYGAELARVYASADVFMFASRTDTFGQVVLEAQASGVPVVAVGEGGPATLIDDGGTGLLTADRPAGTCQTAVHQIVDNPLLAERLRRAALTVSAHRARGRPRCSGLADGYRRALSGSRSGPPAAREVA